jgi:hypothetical protein
MGSSLWFDSSASSWWLFGGRQAPTRSTKSNTKLKIYTDLWRYDTSTWGWSRIFPINKLNGNAGGMTLLRTNLFNDPRTQRITGTKNSNPGVVLCGRTEGKGLDERSLAVYAPRSSRSDTVWQLELKDKQWTAYVCCCDNTERSTGQSTKNSSAMPIGTVKNETNETRNSSVTHSSIKITYDGCNDTTLNINLREDINNCSNTDNTENNIKSSKNSEVQSITLENSIKLDNRESNTPLSDHEISYKSDSSKNENNESIPTHTPNAEEFIKGNDSFLSEHSNISHKGEMNNDNSSVQYDGYSMQETGKHCPSDINNKNVGVPVNNVTSSTNYSDLHEDHTDELTAQASGNITHSIKQRDIKPTRDAHKQSQSESDITTNDSTLNQVFCPDFEISDNSNEKSKGQPVAWCDSNKELLAALDLKVIPLTLWQFDLKTSHWAQQKVN